MDIVEKMSLYLFHLRKNYREFDKFISFSILFKAKSFYRLICSKVSEELLETGIKVEIFQSCLLWRPNQSWY